MTRAQGDTDHHGGCFEFQQPQRHDHGNHHAHAVVERATDIDRTLDSPVDAVVIGHVVLPVALYRYTFQSNQPCAASRRKPPPHPNPLPPNGAERESSQLVPPRPPPPFRGEGTGEVGLRHRLRF